MSVRIALLAAAILAAAAPARAAPAYSVDFTPYIGGATPGALPVAGNVLSFSSPSDPGGFTIDANPGLFKGLGAVADSFASFATELDIGFANAVTGLAFSFAIANLGGTDSLTVTSSTGATANYFAGPAGGGFVYPQGGAVFTGPAFTSLRIVDTAGNAFAIGKISSVPEPVTLAVLGAALAGLAAARRRA